MDLFKKGDSKLRCESKCEVECENSIRGKTSGTDDYMCPPNQQTNREFMDSDKMALLNVLKEMDLFKKGDSKLRCESKCEVECENSIRGKTYGTDDYMCPPNQQTNRELMDSDKMDLFKKGDSKLRCESKCEVECENSIRGKTSGTDDYMCPPNQQTNRELMDSDKMDLFKKGDSKLRCESKCEVECENSIRGKTSGTDDYMCPPNQQTKRELMDSDKMALLNVLKEMDLFKKGDSKLRCESKCEVECENSIRGKTSGTDDYMCPPNQQTNRELMDSDKMDLFKKGDSKLRCESKCEVECENSIRGKTSGTDDYMCPPNQQTNRELMENAARELLMDIMKKKLKQPSMIKSVCRSSCRGQCVQTTRGKMGGYNDYYCKT
ncbi:uncharacterized protein [Amphiura filiformis]|uniref:uncharacterized protein isoform X2 n=1 Tax=Amphiura filiformis TaxID=82378 RepID=UPI003B2161C8